jgi:hypothetical protein
MRVARANVDMQVPFVRPVIHLQHRILQGLIEL